MSAVVLWLWTTHIAPYRAQGRAAAALRALGCSVTTEPAGPAWLAKLVGEDLVNVTECTLYHDSITDADLVDLNELSNLKMLILCDRKLSDAELKQLKSMTNLHVLLLHNTIIAEELEKDLPKTHVYRVLGCPFL